MKILQINSVANSGSTGRIAEEIGNVLLQNGHESYLAYGRGHPSSTSKLIRIGSTLDAYGHRIHTFLTDRHAFASKTATRRFIKKIEEINPDVIGLHNLHGYYINIKELFDYLKKKEIPVLWTLFDCWAFTGHCTYFDDIHCEKWMTHCEKCPKIGNYPSAYIDNSFRNFHEKRELFTSLKNMELVTHSQWLADLVKTSFLKEYPVHVTPSAINLNLFKASPSNLREKHGFQNKKIILGCASSWSNRKGYMDFLELNEMFKDEYQIVMIGLNNKELRDLPKNILGLGPTENIEELAKWYSVADVFVNPTAQDNFPTTNLESMACGTPVVTYNTGGSPEAIDETTGRVVNKGDVRGLKLAIEELLALDQNELSQRCRQRTEQRFDGNKRYLDYLEIYRGLLKA